MARLISQIICGVMAIIASAFMIILVLSNRAQITLDLMPLPYQVILPTYLLMAIFFIAGLLLGLLFYMQMRIQYALLQRKLRRQLIATANASAATIVASPK